MLGDIKIKEGTCETNVKGVFACGDCVTMYKVTPGAISTGCNAGVGVVGQLQAEDFGAGRTGLSLGEKMWLPWEMGKLVWMMLTRGSGD
jgi:hypothetical protein